MTLPGIQVWKKRALITERQVAELVYKASLAGAKNIQVSALRPIVEFFPLQATESKQGKTYQLITTKTNGGSKHEYLNGLREELKEHFGVYVFFDSRGRAIYVGKARKQSLWAEMR